MLYFYIKLLYVNIVQRFLFLFKIGDWNGIKRIHISSTESPILNIKIKSRLKVVFSFARYTKYILNFTGPSLLNFNRKNIVLIEDPNFLKMKGVGNLIVNNEIILKIDREII